ncbi:MAG: VWA domain-containing protein [Acidiferrobacter sp.]
MLPLLRPDEVDTSYLPLHGPVWHMPPSDPLSNDTNDINETAPASKRIPRRIRERVMAPKRPSKSRQAKGGSAKAHDAPVSAPDGGSGGRAQDGAGSRPNTGTPRSPVSAELATWRFPEWDYKEDSYRPDWAYVYVKIPRERDAAIAAALLHQHAGVLRRMRRVIQSFKPTRMKPLRRQLLGEDLDMDATVDFVVERRAGMTPEPRIYRRQLPKTHDFAVLCLADVSTSVMQEVEGGGRLIDRIRASMLLLGEALTDLGDTFALYGFASNTRRQVHLYAFKRFADRYDNEAKARLGGISGHWATRMGATIRFGVQELQAAGSHYRLLLLLTDGRPSDYDHQDTRYLEEDAGKAVREAARQGVRVFGISVDPQGGEYLLRIFGAGHYLILSDIDTLPAKLTQIYLNFTAKSR